MILKMRVAQFSSVGEVDGWLYVDQVREAHQYGQLMVDGRDGPEIGTFATIQELMASVERMWGPFDVRSFDREFWPEMPTVQDPPIIPMTAHCVRLEHEDGRRTLAILMHDAFLLGDDGKTIDRLR